jgi:hypothetical protein
MWQNEPMEQGNTLNLFAEGMIYLITLILALYTVVLAYHWLNYGSNKKISVIALAIFVAGSAALVLGLVVSYNFF